MVGPQVLDKFRREFFELVDVLRLTKKGERQFAHVCANSRL